MNYADFFTNVRELCTRINRPPEDLGFNPFALMSDMYYREQVERFLRGGYSTLRSGRAKTRRRISNDYGINKEYISSRTNHNFGYRGDHSSG